MTRLRRRAADSPTHTSREPRLVLRFAIVTAIGLALAGGAILAVVREIDQRQAVRAATDRAHFVAETFLGDVFRESDAAAPVEGARRRELDALMREYVLLDGALRVSLVGRRNVVTYSTDHSVIGTRTLYPTTIREARSGEIVSRVGNVRAAQGDGTTVKALVANVPVVLDEGTVDVVVLEQDYAPIAAAAHASLLPVAGVLEIALVLFFVLLVPVLARASRRLREYVAEIRYRATHDTLTGLPNRDALADSLAEALRERSDGDSVAVLILDLDRFKEVNDALGHDAGDDLLQDLATRLAGTAADGLLARLGGDEFAVAVVGTTPEEAMRLGRALLHEIEAPRTIRGIPVSVDASIGVALCPDDGDEAGQLLRRAEIAMYAAKRTYAGVVRYDAEDDGSDAAKLALMSELRAAVEREELEVHYQPVVAAATGALSSVEALVRWRHPTRGMLPPGVFLPLAEHTRLVIDLNRVVLRAAARQCAEWRRQGVAISVGVNMTILDLLERSLPGEVDQVLRDAGLPHSALVVEITEGAFAQEQERVRATLDALRARGARVAIDDFGTGYSSLSYLRDLPVDILKIDRSFVTDLAESEASTAIVAAAIELAHRLGLTVVAEGVETELQYELLAELGCDLIQGYLVSKPLPADELTARITGESQADEPRAA